MPYWSLDRSRIITVIDIHQSYYYSFVLFLCLEVGVQVFPTTLSSEMKSYFLLVHVRVSKLWKSWNWKENECCFWGRNFLDFLLFLVHLIQAVIWFFSQFKSMKFEKPVYVGAKISINVVYIENFISFVILISSHEEKVMNKIHSWDWFKIHTSNSFREMYHF